MKKFKTLMLFAVLLCLSIFAFGCVKTVQAEFTIEVKQNMIVGQSQEIKLNVSVGDETEINSAAVISVDDDSVVSLDGKTITALQTGFVTITATYGNVTAEAYVVVEETRTVKYELNGGVCKGLKSELTSSEIYTLPTPTKEGCIFLGWYSNKSFSGNPITELNSTNSSVKTLYASWRSEDYIITYVLTTDGVDGTKEEYTKFTTDYTLTTPDMDTNKYVFSGWYLERNLYNEVTYLEAGYNKDVKVYGVLAKKDAKVNIVLNTNGGSVEGDIKFDMTIGTNTIPTPVMDKFTFMGWFKDYNMKYQVSGNIYHDYTLYAKFVETYPVNEITITNTDVDVERKDQLQITYLLNPTNASVSDVTYESSDTTIATVDENGYVTGLKVGKVMIKVTSKSETKLSASVEIEVYEPDYFEVSYDTTSTVLVGNKIKLNAKYHLRGQNNVTLKWSSSDSSIATVENGIVKGIKAGSVKITCSVEGKDASFDFGVTVYDNTLSDVAKFILNANNSNICNVSNLPIGAGIPVYHTDVVGSVNKLLFQEYTIDRSWEATQDAIDYNHGGEMTKVEFITVHYTGNMAKGADGNANAGYFASGGNGTSIHYVTGNDGIFSCLNDKLIGFHAGDGATEESEIDWYPTGIAYKKGDPIKPTWGISENGKFTLNGQETIIEVPLNRDGVRVTDSKWLNDMGFGYKVVNNEYYMDKTWWCYTQVAEGRICNHGGNRNSIGIESAVNEGSDLWYTWQITAQLVAHLLIQEDLTIDRVVGHHFFSAKNCPQPMLENELELWYEFIELVQVELDHFTTYENYKFEIQVLDGAEYVKDTGRVCKQDNEYHCFTYKVIITNKTTSAKEEIVLSSLLEGLYSR